MYSVACYDHRALTQEQRDVTVQRYQSEYKTLDHSEDSQQNVEEMLGRPGCPAKTDKD